MPGARLRRPAEPNTSHRQRRAAGGRQSFRRPPLTMTGAWRRHAADLGQQPDPTSYDAAWAAAAGALGIPPVMAGALWLRSGLGDSPGALLERLRLGR